MATTYTTRVQLGKPATGDRTWDVPVNANTTQLEAMNALGSLCVTLAEVPSASLNVVVAPGTFISSAGAYVSYAGATQAVTASTTTYLWLTDAGVLTTGAAWPGSGTKVVRLASVVAGTSTITSITDGRVPFVSAG